MSQKPRGFSYVLAALCLASVLSGCGSTAQAPSFTPQADPTTGPNRPAAVTAAPSQPTPEPDPEPTSEATPAPTEKPVATQPPVVTQAPHQEPSTPYQFGTFVEETARVDDSWFGTAAFIGDSRTEGLKAFSGLKYGDFLFSRGMNVFRVDSQDYKVVSIDGKDYTILEALALKQYQSVYIMMGINELGYPLASYRSGLSKLLQRVNEIQPNAVIYLQTLPPVNEETAQKYKLNASINNSNVAAFNQVIVELAAQYKVVLVDTGAAYRDENGSLPADLASDGVHFSPGAYRRWVDYMASHTMSFQRFDQSRKQG